jgi:hypothetical protein
MNRRIGTKVPSTVLLNLRVTPDEADRIRGLAYYLGKTYSQMFRDFAESERRRLLDEGKRPPLHPPEVEGLEDGAQSRWPTRKKRVRTS